MQIGWARTLPLPMVEKSIDVYDSRTTLNNLHQAPIPGVVVVAAYSDFVVPESQWVKKTGPAAG